jgi:hypothetical protein
VKRNGQSCCNIHDSVYAVYCNPLLHAGNAW